MAARSHRLLHNPKEIRILTFGNSLTEGYCDHGSRFHPYGTALLADLSSHLPDTTVTVDVNGQSGDRVLKSLAGHFPERLQKAIPKKSKKGPYDFVILLGGTNDLGYMFGDAEAPAKIFEGLEQCYETVLRSGASLICLTIPERQVDTMDSNMARKAKSARLDLNALIEEFVGAQQDKAGDERRVFVWDFASEVPFVRAKDKEGQTALWSSDGLHMTSEGYDHVGKKLAQFIIDLLKQE